MRITEDFKQWLRFSLLTISRQKWITWLGIAGAVASAAVTQAGAIRPLYGLILTFISTLAAAIGRALADSVGNQYLTVAAILFAVGSAITASTDLFSKEILTWAGLGIAVLAAFGKAAFNIEFRKENPND